MKTGLMISPEILRLVGEVDEFKGGWTKLTSLAPELLTELVRGE